MSPLSVQTHLKVLYYNVNFSACLRKRELFQVPVIRFPLKFTSLSHHVEPDGKTDGENNAVHSINFSRRL